MITRTVLAALLAGFVISQSAHAQPERPDWITGDSIKLLEKIGVDPQADLETAGNYHWRWRARGKLSVGGFSCPAGSTVDISRNIRLIMAPDGALCSGAKLKGVKALKLLPNGSVEPL